jgi:membrane protein DedA with SNARE-associated domain
LETLINQYGYLIIFVITFFEGETVLIIAAVLARGGLLDIDLCILSAFLGSVFGDQLFFHFARHEGYDFVKKFKYLSAVLPRADKLVKRHGAYVVLFSRFIYGLRTALTVICGLGKMPPMKFGIYNAISALIWAVSYGFLGYFFGKAIGTVAGLSEVRYVIVAIIAIVALVYWIVRTAKAKRLFQDDSEHAQDRF